jgi:hypothetical protein
MIVMSDTVQPMRARKEDRAMKPLIQQTMPDRREAFSRDNAATIIAAQDKTIRRLRSSVARLLTNCKVRQRVIARLRQDQAVVSDQLTRLGCQRDATESVCARLRQVIHAVAAQMTDGPLSFAERHSLAGQLRMALGEG